ncbi:SEC-C domain-containing protein [Desulfobulbus rhabdoformis]|uniref:SEC-C metal-binding domain-containing protein n=1 Tax=Desulfobulbus rhabdoformis TaxID=34032 RepID=UPI00196287D1|nr:SEC-C metal-binding domain-containing protein [Desulfobulbus rhabdoformis]MBM9616206.1 SEC-C domain-containing protein [Desulfobulbus rhabdoformis]
MGKIGRNHPCPCGSGKKYKHCCLPAERVGAAPQSAASQMKVSLLTTIEKLQGRAALKKASFHELGVFLFYSDAAGDAWMLEATESDAVQIAQAGEALEVPIDENPETIEINFSHTFALKNRELVLTAYSDKSEITLTHAPSQQIHAAIRRLHKRYPQEMLAQMHVTEGELSDA